MPEPQVKKEITFKVIVNPPGSEKVLAEALPQFARSFSLPEEAAHQILSAAPIVLMTGLTKNEIKILKPALIKLSTFGLEFKVTVVPDKGIPYVIWPFRPHITPNGLEENIPGIAFEWRNTAVVCPSCGETFAIKPVGKTNPPKPEMSQPAIAEATPSPSAKKRQDETVQAAAVQPVKPTQKQVPIQPPIIPPRPVFPKSQPAPAEPEEAEAVEPADDQPLEVAELTDEEPVEAEAVEAEEAPVEAEEAQEEPVEAEEAEEAGEAEEAVPAEVASDDTAYEEQPPQQFSGDELIVMDDAPVIMDVPENQVPQASPYYIKQEESSPADTTPVEPEELIVDPETEQPDQSSEQAEDVEVVEEPIEKPTVKTRPVPVPPPRKGGKPPAGQQRQGAASNSVFLNKIANPAKRSQAAQLISEITGVSVEEAGGLVNRSVIPILKNVSKEEAQDCLNRFSEIGLKGYITAGPARQ